MCCHVFPSFYNSFNVHMYSSFRPTHEGCFKIPFLFVNTSSIAKSKRSDHQSLDRRMLKPHQVSANVALFFAVGFEGLIQATTVNSVAQTHCRIQIKSPLCPQHSSRSLMLPVALFPVCKVKMSLVAYRELCN